ncbi:Ribonuclease HI [Vitis vinifera]|uniref:Ribonuclease HI n=1 Tax=Vitis vinifera TaxID=29760 RepID=A0A438DV93_VITVI|nr:Ribonuclease HI [Vitis vinifera]
MHAPKTKKEIRSFLGRLQYINRFIARLTDICEPIFRLLRKNQPTVWNDDCQFAFEKIKEYLLSPPVLVPPTHRTSTSSIFVSFRHGLGIISWATRRLRHYMTEYSVHLISRLDPLRYLFDRPALTGRLMRWLVLLTEFDIQYVSQKSIKGNEEFVAMTSLSGWCLYFDGAANQLGYGIGVLLVSPQGDHIPRSVRLAFHDRHPITNNIVEYEACILGLETALELGIRQMEVFGDSNLVLRQIQGDWKIRDVKLRPYHAYLELLVARFDDLRYVHLPRAQNRFADALATLASSVDIPIDVVIRPLLIELRSVSAYCCLIGEQRFRMTYLGIMTFISFLDLAHTLRSSLCRSSDERGSFRSLWSAYGGHMLARKIMRTGYFWLTMEIDCCRFVQKCPECQIHGDLIHAPPSELHALTSPWPFSVWVGGNRIIREVTSVRVASFIRPHIICRYGVPHELISDRGCTFELRWLRLLEIGQKSFLLHYGHTAPLFALLQELRPYSLVYGMEAVLPVEIEMGSLRVALEQQISETEWAQARFDQLNLLDERRLRAADHVQAYQRKMTRAFKKWVKPRPLQNGT